MSRANPARVSFSAGEVSPFLNGRTDLAKYQTGARTLENFLVLPQGPILKRRGTKYLTAAEGGTDPVRFYPFIFSRTDCFVIELTPGKIRFITETGYLEDTVGSGPYIEIITPYTAEELEELCLEQQGNLVLITHASHKPRKLLRSDEVWLFEEMDFYDGPYLDQNDDNGTVLTLSVTSDTCPLAAAASVFVAGDVGKLVEFTVDGDWRLARVSSVTDGFNAVVTMREYDQVLTYGTNIHIHYRVNDSGSHWLESSGPTFGAMIDGAYTRTTRADNLYVWVKMMSSNADNVTSESYGAHDVAMDGETVRTYGRTTGLTLGDRTILGTLTCNKSLFTADDVGRHIRLQLETRWTWVKITAFSSSTSVDVQIMEPLPRATRDITRYADDGSTSKFRLGAWSATTGWPRVVTFFEQRAVFASTTTQPQTLWMSVTDDYENHAPTELDSSVVDTNGVTYTIATPEVNAIQWMSSGQTLLIGTSGAEYQVRASSTVNEPVTARNIFVTRQGTHGSLPGAKSLYINAATIFLAATGRAIYEMVYSFENDSFVSKDLTIFSEHILRNAEQLAFQEDPHKIIWVRLANGTLAACTYMRDQEVLGWHRHTISTGQVEAMCVLPYGEGGWYEALYLCVIAPDGTRHIELLDSLFEPTEDHAAYISENPFLDGYANFDAADETLFPVPHLTEGSSVSYLIDGIYQGTGAVSGGQVELAEPVTGRVTIGLPYTAKVESMPLDTGSPIGTGLGKTGRVDRVGMVLVSSLFFSVFNGSDWYVERLGSLTSETEAYSALYTGILQFSPFDTYELEQTVAVRSTLPYPLCIAAILPQHETNE